MQGAYLQKIGLDTFATAAPPAHLLRGKEDEFSSGGGGAANGIGNFGADLLKPGKGFGDVVVRGNHPPWCVPNGGHDAKLMTFNSVTGEKEAFIPVNGKDVIWYTCGPTVYDVSHMGHARAYLTFDILRRIMKDYLGFNVKYQINITDIDDKIILKSRQNKLFDDFKKEAAGLSAKDLKKAVDEALQFAEAKLKKKAPEEPKADSPPREKAEYETLVQEHKLKLGQHAAIVAKAAEALKGGQVDAILNSVADAVKGKLDKEKGHTVSDHSIFDAHARKYEDEYFDDMDALGVLRPDTVTRISSYMDGRVQKFIEKLENDGVCYESRGSVYFDIDAFKAKGYHYRKCVPAANASAKEMEEGEGALAAEDAEKRNANDFAVWKASKPGEPAWESKWGPGRPGWHIECSVMATDINGEYLDIHAGGEDLKFPHHDNEMAQSEAYLERSQWVNYFWHAGHLSIEGLKMSKSLKNFITIRQALTEHSARQLRIMFLMQAWDKGMNYSDQAVDMAKAEERKVKSFLGTVVYWTRKAPKGPKPCEKAKALEASVASTKETIHAAILDNFTTPKVVEAVSKLVSNCKDYMNAMPDVSFEPVKQAAALVEKTLGMLGVERLTTSKEQAATWEAALDAFADLRQEVRETDRKQIDVAKVTAIAKKLTPAADKAKKAGLSELAEGMLSFQKDLEYHAKNNSAVSEVLKRCDAVRDKDFVKLGARLADRGSDGYVWYFEDRAAIEAELREGEEKAREAGRAKARNKLDQKQKELKTAEKSAIEPKLLFTCGANEGLYAEFGDDGLPAKTAGGEELSAKKKKDLVKELAKQQKEYEKIQKQAGDGGVEAVLAKLRKEVAELEEQVGSK